MARDILKKTILTQCLAAAEKTEDQFFVMKDYCF